MSEEWRPIEGFPSYEISNLSRIRRVVGGQSTRVGRILKPVLNVRGYLTVGLSEGGKTKSREVHRLVALAFIPNPENKPCADHINGVKTDNRLDNLRWSTYLENGRNRAKPQHNTSGFMGVSFSRRAAKFVAKIMLNGRTKHLGYFPTAEQAGLIAGLARRKHFGVFSRNNT